MINKSDRLQGHGWPAAISLENGVGLGKQQGQEIVSIDK